VVSPKNFDFVLTLSLVHPKCQTRDDGKIISHLEEIMALNEKRGFSAPEVDPAFWVNI